MKLTEYGAICLLLALDPLEFQTRSRFALRSRVREFSSRRVKIRTRIDSDSFPVLMNARATEWGL